MSIAVGGVHVQVAAIPSGTLAQRCTGEGICCRAVERLEEDFGLVRSCALRADVGDADEQLPFAGNQFAGKVRRSRVVGADGECALVASAPTPKSVRIFHTQIERSLLFFA